MLTMLPVKLLHFGIKHLQVSGFQLPQGQIPLAEVRSDWLLDHCGVRTVCCHSQPSLGDLQPFQQIIGKQHIAAQVAHLFGRLKLRPEPRQLRLRLALVALFGKPQCDPFRFPLPSGYTEEQMRRDIIKGLELLKRQRERNRDAR